MAGFDTPVALFGFNRPEPTRSVFNVIRQVRPKRLFFVADGPRGHVQGEAEKCQAVRAIAKEVDWDCVVETNFSDQNLGCGRRMSSGIAWVFERSEEAIFLEDDCVPSLGFFEFCAALLERYRDDERIGMISGDCFLPESIACPDSYYFSRYPHIWGWASWRRAWRNYRFELGHLDLDTAREYFLDQFERPEVGQFFLNKLLEIRSGKNDTWDFQVTYSFIVNSLLTVLPSRNLVSNIGFGAGATHTHDAGAWVANMTAKEPDRVLRHPSVVSCWRRADRFSESKVFGIQPPAAPLPPPAVPPTMFDRLKRTLSRLTS
jgi:hypothetical protein